MSIDDHFYSDYDYEEIEPHIEACDDGAQNGAGEGFCDSVCSIVQTCGDGIRTGSEVCDDGNTDNNDSCVNQCTTRRYCGDRVVSGSEAM